VWLPREKRQKENPAKLQGSGSGRIETRVLRTADAKVFKPSGDLS